MQGRDKGTVFENHRKSLIQHCERSELRLHSVTRQDNFNRTNIGEKCRMPKLKNETFLVIFKHCDAGKAQAQQLLLRP